MRPVALTMTAGEKDYPIRPKLALVSARVGPEEENQSGLNDTLQLIIDPHRLVDLQSQSTCADLP
jgi:hypothetical protein